MAERYNERDDRDRPWRDAGEYSGRGDYSRTRGREGERGTWRRDHERDDDRGFMDRAGDEVRSWFGDEEAARRRELDERREARERERGWNRDEGWRHVPERERYRISDDWDQREYSARMSGSSAYGTGSGDWRGRAPHRGEWRGDWRGDSHRSTPAYLSEPHGYGERGSRGESPASRDYGWGAGTSWTGERSMRSGPHAGKGPRGYQRSDDRITEEICDLLTRDPNVDASGIEVSVQQGEVTLRGTVDSRYEKRATEDLAEGVQGVRQVHNELRVNDGQTMTGAPGIESSTVRGNEPSTPEPGDESRRRSR